MKKIYKSLFSGLFILIFLIQSIQGLPINNFANPTSSQKDIPLQIRDQLINILSPANTTYIEPTSGYYLDSWGFEKQKIGELPKWFDEVGTSGGSVQIIGELDGHQNVLELFDTNSNDSAYVIKYLVPPPSSGTIEYWMRTNDSSKINGFRLSGNVSGEEIATIRTLDNYLQISKGASPGFDNVAFIENNEWYHIRVDFECTPAGYEGLAQYRWCLYLNGEKFGPTIFVNYALGQSQKIEWFTDALYSQSSYYYYLDAIGVSWDEEYNVGDNLNEGLLLTYKTDLNLEWSGYSFDNQVNKTLAGNTTIPFPSYGSHSIQVFCNDSFGFMYKSEIQIFSIWYTETYSTNVDKTDYFFSAKGAYYLAIEVTGTDFTNFTLDYENYNISYGTNLIPIDLGAELTLHKIVFQQVDINQNHIKWFAVEPVLLSEGNISVNLESLYNLTVFAAGPISILVQPDFSYNWLYIAVDNIILNNIYNTASYPEIDSAFLSYMSGGSYLQFNLDTVPKEHTISMKGNGTLAYKIVVNYDWDVDLIDDVEEIQKELSYPQLDPVEPNVWGYFENTSTFLFSNSTGNIILAYFSLYIPITYTGPAYLYIFAENGEISGIAVDEDEFTLKDVYLNCNRTPYGVLSSGFHIISLQYRVGTLIKNAFQLDSKQVLVLDEWDFKDSDADGVKDQVEQSSALDLSNPDSDQDGLPDNLDLSPLSSLLVDKNNIQQIVIPHNPLKNTMITMTIRKPNPDYSSISNRKWIPNSFTGYEIIIQPVLRLYGNPSISRTDLATFWKGAFDRVNCYSLVDNYPTGSVGDAIPDPTNPDAEFMFLNPTRSNESFEFQFSFPKGHPAKIDNAIDLRFDFVWLIFYYNATNALKILHYYPLQSDVVLQSITVQEVGNVNYILGSPDSMIENQILWALVQNPQLGSFSNYNVADDVVGSGFVDYFGLFNCTLEDRKTHPRGPTDTEVLYIAGNGSNYDVLNKINLKLGNFQNPSFEINHSGEFEARFGFYSISNLYPKEYYDSNDPDINGESKLCYTVRWNNYTEDGIFKYELRADMKGFPIYLNCIDFQNSKILEITEALGTEIPLSNIPYSLKPNLYDRIVFCNKTYIEFKTTTTGIPLLNFDYDKDVYKEILDVRYDEIEKSKLIFYDYGIPVSELINTSYYEFKNANLALLSSIQGLQFSQIYGDFESNILWDQNAFFSLKIAQLNILSNTLKNLQEYLAQIKSNLLFEELNPLLSFFKTALGAIMNLDLKTLQLLYNEIDTLVISNIDEAIKLKKGKPSITEKIKGTFESLAWGKNIRLKLLSGRLTEIYYACEMLYYSIVLWKGIVDYQKDPSLSNFANGILIPSLKIVIAGLKIGLNYVFLHALKTYSPILIERCSLWIAKYAAKICTILAVIITIIELIPQAIHLFTEHFSKSGFWLDADFWIDITVFALDLTFGVIIPLVMVISSAAFPGVGTLVGVVISIFLMVADFFDWFGLIPQPPPQEYHPHLTIRDDYTDLRLNAHAKDTMKREGSLVAGVGDGVELDLGLLNDGDNDELHLECYLKFGYTYGGWNTTELEVHLERYQTANLVFKFPIYESQTDLTVILRIHTDLYVYPNPPIDFFNVINYIPLGLPVVPNGIAAFYAETYEWIKIDYDKVIQDTNKSIANYQYLDAANGLNYSRTRVAYDFLEDNEGTVPNGWYDTSDTGCTVHVEPVKAGHYNITHFQDGITSGSAEIYGLNESNALGDLTRDTGTVEFWLYKEASVSAFHITLQFSVNQRITFCFAGDSNIYYGEGTTENPLARHIFFNESWYHVQIAIYKSYDPYATYALLYLNGIFMGYREVETYVGTNGLYLYTDYAHSGNFYIDNLDVSWASGYYNFRSLFWWNYTLADINKYQSMYAALPCQDNFRLDFEPIDINIDPSVGWTTATVPLVIEGDDNQEIDYGITFFNGTNFYTYWPNFTDYLDTNNPLVFDIYSKDKTYLGGTYYFKVDVKLHTSGQMVYSQVIPFRISFHRDIKYTPSNTVFQKDINIKYTSQNINNPINFAPITVNTGTIMLVRCKTNEDLKIHLYYNSQKIKTFSDLIERESLDYNSKLIEIVLDENLTFNKLYFDVGAMRYDGLMVYDLLFINATIKGADNQPFWALNITNMGNIGEYISFKFAGIPFNYVNQSLYPTEFNQNEEQLMFIMPGEQRECWFCISKPNYSVSNLISRSIIVNDPYSTEIYTKYVDYLSVEGIHIINPKNITYFIYKEAEKGIWLNILPEAPLTWIAYSLDGNLNVSFSREVFIPLERDGSHAIQVFGRTALNNTLRSELVYFTVKSNLIKILSLSSTLLSFNGTYKSTLGFEDCATGKMPWCFEVIQKSGGSVNVIGAYEGHTQVVQLHDTSSWNPTGARKKLPINQVSGTVESWMLIDRYEYYSHSLKYNGIPVIQLRFHPNRYIECLNGGSWLPFTSHCVNVWYHIRVDFECSSHFYQGLTQYKYYIYINETRFGPFSFYSQQSSINEVEWWTSDASIVDCYLDGIGFSWDPNYHIADNYMLGIPLTLNLPTYLVSLKYSVDSQTPISLLRNSSFAALTGLHNVTVFGISLNGTLYENSLYLAYNSLELKVALGYNQCLSIPNLDYQFNFSSISEAGSVMMTLKDRNKDPLINLNWNGYPLLPLGMQYYTLNFSLRFSGALSICIPYDATLIDTSAEKYLRLFLWENLTKSWLYVTTSFDTQKNVIYGRLSTSAVPKLVVMQVVDNQGPIIIAHLNTTLCSSSSYSLWYSHSGLRINITAMDEFSNVSTIQYHWDYYGTYQPYTAPLNVSSDGQYFLSIRAQDSKNKWRTVDIEIFIDKIHPNTSIINTITMFYPNQTEYHIEPNSWFSFSVNDTYLGANFSLSTTDLAYTLLYGLEPDRIGAFIYYQIVREGDLVNFSDANFVRYGLEPFRIDYSPGTYVIYYYSVDSFGNVEPMQQLTLIIDAVPITWTQIAGPIFIVIGMLAIAVYLFYRRRMRAPVRPKNLIKIAIPPMESADSLDSHATSTLAAPGSPGKTKGAKEVLYSEKLRCIMRLCSNNPPTSLEVRLKDNQIINIYQCPECKRVYECILPLKDKDLWLPTLRTNFFHCTHCGTPNEDNKWVITGGENTLKTSPILKIFTKCKKCKSTVVKVFPKSLLGDLRLKINVIPIEKKLSNTPHLISPLITYVLTVGLQKGSKTNYLEKLSCTMNKCTGTPTNSLVLVVEDNQVVNLHQCPECYHGYESFLPLADKILWMPLIRRSFFNCDHCGASNGGVWQVSGGEKALETAKVLKISNTCKKCKSPHTKLISKSLWADLQLKSENPTPAKPVEKKLAKKKEEKTQEAKKIMYSEKLSCIMRECTKTPPTSLELRIEGDQVVNIYRCPECKREYECNLPLKDKELWMPLLRTSFFNCDLCGTPNDAWEISGGEKALETAETLKISTTCRNCGTLRIKHVSKALRDDFHHNNEGK